MQNRTVDDVKLFLIEDDFLPESRNLSLSGLSYDSIFQQVVFSSRLTTRYICFESLFVGTSHLRFGTGPMVTDNGGTRALTAHGRIGDDWDEAMLARFRDKVLRGQRLLEFQHLHRRHPELQQRTVGFLVRRASSKG